MNKTLKTILIVALCLFGVGMLTLIGTSIVTGYKLTDVGTAAGEAEVLPDEGSVKTVEKEFKDGKQELDINVSFADVSVGVSSDSKIHLSYTESNKVTFSLRETDGKIVLSQNHTNFSLFSFMGSRCQVELLIPKNHAGGLYIDSASGNVDVCDIGIGGKLEINTASGSVDLRDCAFSDSDVSTASGSVRLQSVDTATIDISTASGSVDVSDCSSKADTDISTASGDITLDSGTFGSLGMSTNSGRNTLDVVKAESCFIESAAGDCDITDGDFKQLRVRNISGHVRGTLTGEDEDYEIVSSSVSGRNTLLNLGKMGAKRSIEVATTSGDIGLEFIG